LDNRLGKEREIGLVNRECFKLHAIRGDVGNTAAFEGEFDGVEEGITRRTSVGLSTGRGRDRPSPHKLHFGFDEERVNVTRPDGV
jgi:hypothetical protein